MKFIFKNSQKKIAVIIPAHNEEKVLRNTIYHIRKIMNSLSKNYEIIIAENGSTDKTYRIAKNLSSLYPEVKVIKIKKIGKGIALSTAISSILADIYILSDADMPVRDLKSFKELIKQTEKHHIVIGSRYLPSSKILNWRLKRIILSKIFNKITNLLFCNNISDYNCGFKAFTKEVREKILCQLKAISWDWDVEFIIKSKLCGLDIFEIPIVWRGRDESKLKIPKVVPSMLFRLLLLRLST